MKSKIKNVGPSQLSKWFDNMIPNNVLWGIAWYHAEPYEGSGTAVFAMPKGKFVTVYLGHCSCYGPLENAKWDALMTLKQVREELKSNPGDCDYECKSALLAALNKRLAKIRAKKLANKDKK